MNAYNYEIETVPGKSNPADAGSRLTTDTWVGYRLKLLEEQEEDKFVWRPEVFGSHQYKIMTIMDATQVLTLEMVAKEIMGDVELTQILQALQSDDWPEELDKKWRRLRPFLTWEEGVVWNDNRLWIPKDLRKRALEIAHRGHAAYNSMIRILDSLYWPKMRDDIRTFTKNCEGCILVDREGPDYCKMSVLPEEPWQHLAVDHFEMPGIGSILTITDYFSRFLIASPVKDKSGESTVDVCERYFRLLGYPLSIRSDRGPAFASETWKEYLKSRNIQLVGWKKSIVLVDLTCG